MTDFSEKAHYDAADIALHWTEWNKLNLPDGMTIMDPDGFRHGRPTVINFEQFLAARFECTLVDTREVRL